MSIGPTTKTVADILDYVKRQFGDEAGVQVTDSDIYRFINTGQVEILNKNPILKARANADVVANQHEYTLPIDILNIQSIHYDGNPLEYVSFQEAQELIIKKDSLEGTPTIWYEWAGILNLYPKPDTNLTDGLVIFYIKIPASVTQSADLLSLPDKYYNTLLHYVLQQVYEMDEDWTASGNKANQFEASINVLKEDENYSQINVYPSISVLEEDI